MCVSASKRPHPLALGREQEHRHGALVGRDSFGNTYYENRRYLTSAAASRSCKILQINFYAARTGADRERWVMYADKDDYSAKEVPPDWHGATQRKRSVCRLRLNQCGLAAWLHRISDVAPSSADAAAVYKHPVYEQPWDSGIEAEVRRCVEACHQLSAPCVSSSQQRPGSAHILVQSGSIHAKRLSQEPGRAQRLQRRAPLAAAHCSRLRHARECRSWREASPGYSRSEHVHHTHQASRRRRYSSR